MKRALALALMIIMMLSLAACSIKGKQASPDELAITKAVEITQKLDALASSEDYIDYIGLISATAEIAEFARSFGNGDHKNPESAVIVKLDAEKLFEVYADSPNVAELFDSGDGVVLEYIKKRIISIVPNMMISGFGSIAVTVSSFITESESFISDVDFGDGCVVFLFYRNGDCSITTCSSENGILGVSTRWAPAGLTNDYLKDYVDEIKDSSEEFFELIEYSDENLTSLLSKK